MHPILLHIPLPKGPIKLWWVAVAVAVIVSIYGAIMLFWRKQKGEAYWSFGIAIAVGVAGYIYRASTYQAENIPIYSYGVMLGISLIVGWYITLPLARKDGLPNETMANCYVITALMALAGSRILYVMTNPSEFDTQGKEFGDVLAMYFQIRKGGLVAYGGFLGGFLGSWLYLRARHIRLMPWADVAVPSLASGIFITRIGCYLYGCDFGKRLAATAPGFLKKIGTFPKLPEGTLGYTDQGLPIVGSPAYARHLSLCQEHPLPVGFSASDCRDLSHSLAVHPTQIYESLIGLGLLGFLLWMRKRQVFRGQLFFLFAFIYGVLRFLLELVRDDTERGNVGPYLGEHWLIGGSLLLFGVAFMFGPSVSLPNKPLVGQPWLTWRNVSRFIGFLPAFVAFVKLWPKTYGDIEVTQLSTSQAIGLFSALAVCFFYARYWVEAQRSPAAAMSLGLPEEAPKKKKRKKGSKKRSPKKSEAAGEKA